MRMPYNPLPTQDKLRAILDYNPITGTIFRRETNIVAGYRHRDGYLVIKVNGRSYMAHRLIWMSVYGVDPEARQIDHINGVKSDNRLVNLRLASPGENRRNTAPIERRHDKPIIRPLPGIVRNKNGTYRASIMVEGKIYRLGTYPCIAEAADARNKGATKYHGAFARFIEPNIQRKEPG